MSCLLRRASIARDALTSLAHDPGLRFLEEPLRAPVGRMPVLPKAGAGVVQHGDQQPAPCPCFGACLCTVAKNCDGRTRSGSTMRSRGPIVSVVWSSEVEEKEALKSLPLEGQRRFLPKVRFLVGGMLTTGSARTAGMFWRGSRYARTRTP